MPADIVIERAAMAGIAVLDRGRRLCDKSRLMCMTCKHEWMGTLKSVSGGVGCPACAKQGFNPSRVGYFYVYLFSVLNKTFVGFGITNRVVRRAKAHALNFSRYGAWWQCIACVEGDGAMIAGFERALKRDLKVAGVYIPGFITESFEYSEMAVDLLLFVADTITSFKYQPRKQLTQK